LKIRNVSEWSKFPPFANKRFEKIYLLELILFEIIQCMNVCVKDCSKDLKKDRALFILLKKQQKIRKSKFFVIWINFNNRYVYNTGGVHLPESTAGRTLISCWWLTCIIIVGTYCGNLIAFLTVTKERPPFNSLQEMNDLKDTYKWGTLGGTAWETTFPVKYFFLHTDVLNNDLTESCKYFNYTCMLYVNACIHCFFY
jgi:hypothetical protein